MSELDDLEKLYEVNIQVYSLAPTQSHSEDEDNEENTSEITANLLRCSHHHYSSTLYLSLYENHFFILKTWPSTVNPSAVQDVASTGNAQVI